jgi:hypothetical protein
MLNQGDIYTVIKGAAFRKLYILYKIVNEVNSPEYGMNFRVLLIEMLI